MLFSRRALYQVLAEYLHQNHMGYLFKLWEIWQQPSPFGWGLGLSHVLHSWGDSDTLKIRKCWSTIYSRTRLSPS